MNKSRQQAADSGRRVAWLCLSALSSTWIVGTAIGEGPASQPATPTIQPITYFQNNCARCHGDYGSNYGEQFARNLDDTKLSKVVDDMCSGPGNAPLAGVELQAEIAFHRALADHKPFICITQRDGTGLSGEVTPGAQLQIVQNGKAADVKVDELGDWGATVPDGSELVATKNGRITRLSANGSPFSHDKPAAKP